MNTFKRYLYQPYKWLVYIPFVVASTVFFGILAIVLSFFNKRFSSQVGGSLWARLNGTLIPMTVRVTGRSNIKKNQSYVIVANHQSFVDIFIMYGWLGLDIRWVMKAELRKVPVLGIACKRVGHIFVNRSNTKESLDSINQAKKDIVNGTSVIFFPEGTRSKTGEFGRFKKGAFKFAFDLNLSILPVTIKGAREILPPGGMNLKPGSVQMIIHPPVETAQHNEETISGLMDYVKNIIQQSYTMEDKMINSLNNNA